MFWQRDYPEKQLQAVFEWLCGVVTAEDIIFVDFPGYGSYFYFEFPLRHGDRPKKLRTLPKERATTFIIRKTNQANQKPGQYWAGLFSSPEIEVFENKKRIRGQAEPLRWGLSDAEHKIALRIARDALEIFLSDSRKLPRAYFSVLPMRFSFKTGLGVALWREGHLRGSWVVENHLLGEGLAEAAYNAAGDFRFKPLESRELPETRIEITVMSDLRIPLSENEQARNAIYPEKGYRIVSGQRQGWFLPEVFNARRFRNLEEFLGDLAEEKAGLVRSGYKTAAIVTFEVDDFIESKNHHQSLSLWGPVVKKSSLVQDSRLLIQRLRMAADWLLNIQEPEGNIPPIINPLAGRAVKQIDWPRLAFTARALSEFGRATKEEKYIAAAQKSFEYIRKLFISNPQRFTANHELTFSYFGQLAFCLGELKDAAVAAALILNRLPVVNFEPIAFAQMAGFLKIVARTDSRFSEPLANMAGVLKDNFEKAVQGRQPIPLAPWAELANTFAGIDQGFSNKIADWLKARQLPDGAFPESTASPFSYTRGIGKIFEVLALDFENNKEAISQSLPWLLTMQYDEENSFFISQDLRPKIFGAFRHDYFNPDAWIDAAGHVLLGGARIIRGAQQNDISMPLLA